MKVSLRDIKAMAECPAYYQYLKNFDNKPVPQHIAIVENIMKMCYIQATETGFKSSWRRVVNQVSIAVFANVNMQNQTEIDMARKISEYVLLVLRKWYYDIFMQEQGTWYTDIPIKYEANDIMIETTLPILKLNENPIIMLIDGLETNVSKMYNDISTRAILWFACEALESEIVTVEHLTVKNQGALQIQRLKLIKNVAKRIEKPIQEITEMISKNYSFPSFTEKCKQCPFIKECKI